MKKAIWAMLNGTEQALLREVEPARLRKLGEDDLIDLHARVRRARTKYTKLYRRRATAQVGKDASRAGAHAKHERTVLKAEAFEEALARVSRRLGKVAGERAEQLKAERLAAARRAKGTSRRAKGRSGGTGGGKSGRSRAAKKQRRTPVKKRSSASARAATRRKEAKRDSR